jgi:hypothetical protein
MERAIARMVSGGSDGLVDRNGEMSRPTNFYLFSFGWVF